jgi:hypothetical protein
MKTKNRKFYLRKNKGNKYSRYYINNNNKIENRNKKIIIIILSASLFMFLLLLLLLLIHFEKKIPFLILVNKYKYIIYKL